MARILDTLGLRGLYLVSNQANVDTLDGRPGVWPYVPLSHVLVRCRAAVHSGAAGTTAAVLSAGLPSVVVPHLFDQIWNARRVQELGAGRAIVRRRHSERVLRRAITDVCSNISYTRAATVFAAELAAEGAVATATATACDHIERLL